MNVADVVARNNVCVLGEGEKTLMFAHGFGCNQGMWQQLVERFASDYKIVLFDYMGSGESDIAQFDSEKYSKLEGYADDILTICTACTALKLKNVHLVGHSVSSDKGKKSFFEHVKS